MADRRGLARARVAALVVSATALAGGCGVLPELGPSTPTDAYATSPLASPASPPPVGPSSGSTASTSTGTATATSDLAAQYAQIDIDAATMRRWESSVLRIRSVTCSGVYTGSGFVVDAHTIVTNRHVVKGETTIQVDTVDGKQISVTDVRQASDIDLAVIHSDDTLPTPLPLARTDVKGGQNILAIGYPLGGPIATTRGRVLGWYADTELDGGLALRATAAIDHGNSGGPALDQQGNVVGVIYAKTDSGNAGAIAVTVLDDHLASPTGFVTPPSC